MLVGVAGWALTMAILPDVHVGINYRNSDRVKWLAYHELAHASHYTLAGNAFWERLVLAESLALGHGNAGSRDATLISLVESWGEHVAKTYAHKKYNDKVSIIAHDNYLKFLEKQRNETTDHIPIGYFNDLVDEIDPFEEGCDGKWAIQPCGNINDQVSGFTNAQMFSLLDGSVDSPDDFTTKLISIFLSQTQNTPQQVNDLFESY